MTDFGEKPELAWLPVMMLSVDRSYQRSIESRRSQNLIDKIAENFRWPRFGCVLAIKTGEGWQLIDGQHRTEGARRAGVTHVPAVVLPHESAPQAALDFIAINRDRVTMNPQAVYHALVAAGDEAACRIARVCLYAKISIPKYPKMANQMVGGETLAVGAIRKVVARLGEDRAAGMFKTIASAVSDRPGDLRAPIIEACATLTLDDIDVTKIAAVLANGGVTEVLRAAPVRRDGSMAERVAAEIEARIDGQGGQERKCLSCDEPFMSAGAGNRMCNLCRRNKS